MTSPFWQLLPRQVRALPFFHHVFSSHRGSRNLWAAGCPTTPASFANTIVQLTRLEVSMCLKSTLSSHLMPLQHAGKWQLPPAIAYVNEQPEVMGLAAAQEFKVCTSTKCTSVEIKAAAPHPLRSGTLQSCPSDCSGAGLCDIGTGTCFCDTGFTGADCSSICDARGACAPAVPVERSLAPPPPVVEQPVQSMSARQESSITLAVILICTALLVQG
jgi:hypothetical protein